MCKLKGFSSCHAMLYTWWSDLELELEEESLPPLRPYLNQGYKLA